MPSSTFTSTHISSGSSKNCFSHSLHFFRALMFASDFEKVALRALKSKRYRYARCKLSLSNLPSITLLIIFVSTNLILNHQFWIVAFQHILKSSSHAPISGAPTLYDELIELVTTLQTSLKTSKSSFVFFGFWAPNRQVQICVVFCISSSAQ